MAYGSAAYGSAFRSQLGPVATSAVIEYQSAGSGAIVMNFSGLVTEAQRLAGRVDSNFDDRTKQWINEALDRWAVRDPWGTLTHEDDFTCDGTRDLYLPNYVKKIIRIFDKSNIYSIERHQNWDRDAPTSYAQSTAGKAYWWREEGMSPVCSQPSSAKAVQFNPDVGENVVCYAHGVAQSTLASGTAAQLHVESEYVTCLSGAATSTTRNFIKILTLGKSTLTSGDVIIRYGGVDPAVARIEADAYRSEYRHVQFLQVPTSGTVMTVRYIRRLAELTQNEQVVPPSIDPRFLVWWAAGNIHSSMGQHAEAQVKWSMAEKMLKEEAHYENAFGDQDWRMEPDMNYWHFDE